MENKLYPCVECGRKVPIRSKGRCPSCRQAQRTANGELTNKKVTIQKITPKRKVEKAQERSCRGMYFEYHLNKLNKTPYSEESGRIISEPTTANVCHLLPKRKQGGFPSVQCVVENCVYLTLDEHTLFDRLLDERDYENLELKFPNSWQKVCERFKKLLSLCSERNKMYFSLMEYLKI